MPNGSARLGVSFIFRDLLFPECCHEFNLSKVELQGEYAAVEDISHHDQDIDDLQDDGHSIDASNSYTSTTLDSYQDHIASFEKLKYDEQIESSTGESIRATIDVESSPHLPDLQTRENCNIHAEQNLQGLPNLQFENQKYILSPYEYSISNYDEQRGGDFPNLFHDVIVDPVIQEASSLSSGSYLDSPIFDQDGDEKGNDKVCEDSFFIQISSSFSFQPRDDQKSIDACHKSVENLSSLDISRKDMIIGKEIACCVKPAYHLDETRLQEYQQEAVDSFVCRNESYVVKEDLHDTNGYNENYISVDASDLISVAHAAFDVYEQSFTKEDCSQIFEEVSYDIFPPVIHEKDLKIACLSLPDTEVFCSPIFDEYAAEENILHYDQEIADSHHDSHEDAINIVSNSFIKDDCHDDQIVSFEIFKDDDQITPSENFEHIEHTGILVEDSFRSAEDEEDSLSFSDL